MHGPVDAVQGDERVPIFESDVDDFKSMNVFEICADAFQRDVWLDKTDYKVSGCTTAYSSRNMPRQVELTLVPVHLDLS